MNWKSLVVIAILFGAALLAGRFFAPGDGQSLSIQLPTTELKATWCEPTREACRAELPGIGNLVMEIEPKSDIKPMRPLIATLKMPEGWKAGSLEAVGLNMDMGVNRFVVRPAIDGVQSADFLLPLCALKRMEWQLLVTISDGKQALRVPFQFAIER